MRQTPAQRRSAGDASSLPLAPGFASSVAPIPLDLPPALNAAIDAIWARQKALHGAALFDGRVYALHSYSATALVLREIRYRHVVARRLSPELGLEHYGVRPLGVTGVLACPEGVVLGRRAAKVVDAGLWEPAPSGTLAGPDPERQLLEELAEELGLAPARLDATIACGLVSSAVSGVSDIVFRLTTAATRAEIEAAHRAAPSGEYDALALLSAAALPGFLADQQDRLLPELPAMLKLAGWLAEDFVLPP